MRALPIAGVALVGVFAGACTAGPAARTAPTASATAAPAPATPPPAPETTSDRGSRSLPVGPIGRIAPEVAPE
jgi:hypothetical protein